ncbi:FHA domain-containing protein [Saccharopolyspora taberi]|uniref:FHA domain-containing protein n=1 Tax=Saccharopolyspora taberi TaxID=60895 RepID=A0ABN3VAC7_9PSEU
MNDTLPALPPLSPDAVSEIPRMRPEPAPLASAVGEPAWLVVSRGPDKGLAFMISSAVTTIGRHRDCDIVLDDMTVSRTHAELHRQERGFVLVDGGSLNGTFVNRRPEERVRLADGDQIWLGKVRFTFHTNSPGVARTAGPEHAVRE